MGLGADMVQDVRLCRLAELEDGEIFKAEVPGIGALAVYRIGEFVYATDDTCTHGAASLAEDGYIEGCSVVCSWHDGAFDLRTGEPLRLPCNVALRTYPVTIRDGAVFIAA